LEIGIFIPGHPNEKQQPQIDYDCYNSTIISHCPAIVAHFDHLSERLFNSIVPQGNLQMRLDRF
jgi:hypothetical protein